MIAQFEKLTSRLVSNYLFDLKKWCKRLTESDSTIIAISRKGPRLIELLVKEKLLDKSILDRLISEHALSFYNFKNNEEIILIDDSIQYGSTFNRIYNLIIDTAKLRGIDNIKVLGLPFAVTENVNSTYYDKITEYYNKLKKEEIGSFIDSEISSFGILGKPYDIEYPIFNIYGSFDDVLLQKALQNFVDVLNDSKNLSNSVKLIPIERQITLKDDRYVQKSWTIIFSAFNDRKKRGSEFSKLRIFLSPEKNKICFTSINPFLLSNELLSQMDSFLPEKLKAIWKIVSENIVPENIASPSACEIDYESKRSKIIWANYLFSVINFYNIHELLYENIKSFFPNSSLDILSDSISNYDIQLLLGFDISSKITPKLNEFLNHSKDKEIKINIDNSLLFGKINEEIFPSEYLSDYNHFLNEKCLLSESVYEIVSNIFYSQHLKIEIPLRGGTNSNVERLRFGMTFKGIRDIVLRYCPDAEDSEIHSALDSLIDSGNIVPKYVEMSKETSEGIWVRIFRIGEGEGDTTKRTQVLIFIAETLSKTFKSADLPPTAFEKFSVLSLTTDFGFKALNSNDSLGIKKGYYLYGARSAFCDTTDNKKFLLDWGVSQRIIKQKEDGTYSLYPNVRDSYPKEELPLEIESKRQIQDIASFCQLLNITDSLRTKALVTITTLASEDEYSESISAELELWLFHPLYNVNRCIRGLIYLASLDPGKEENIENIFSCENRLRKILRENANFTAQAKGKKDLFLNKDETFNLIADTVNKKEDLQIERVWEDLKNNLDKKSETNSIKSSGLSEIECALEVAHSLTSFLRNLFSFQQKDFSRVSTVKAAFDKFMLAYNQAMSFSELTKSFFNKGKDGDNINIEVQLNSLSKQINEDISFYNAIDLLKSTLFNIVLHIENLLKSFGPTSNIGEPITISRKKFILMWDIKKSSNFDDTERTELEKNFILIANERIRKTLGDKIMDFHPQSGDDGNGFICDDFKSVLSAIRILHNLSKGNDIYFRAGCDVNVFGGLRFYQKNETLAGKAYEYAARITSFFKELKEFPGIWSGDKSIAEPSSSYLLISEFAQRFANYNDQLNISDFSIEKFNGEYKPRINKDSNFPYSIYVLTPKA